jgi:hypothetical protein
VRGSTCIGRQDQNNREPTTRSDKNIKPVHIKHTKMFCGLISLWQIPGTV